MGAYSFNFQTREISNYLGGIGFSGVIINCVVILATTNFAHNLWAQDLLFGGILFVIILSVIISGELYFTRYADDIQRITRPKDETEDST